ncbi:MAG TPA: hypothetical protein VH877_00685 [Polyangia bacterium]|jgi:hypothetical protein|nr:hypothetical protein [Polyangia bacterium]
MQALGLGALLWISLLWAGLVIGISFIEAPAKFRAPSLTRPVALDVGRHVFRASHMVQLAMAAALWPCAALAPMSLGQWLALGLGEALFFVQHLWLLPALDHRAQAIITGQAPADGSPHALYVVLEVVKLSVLLGLGYSLLRVLLAGGTQLVS